MMTDLRELFRTLDRLDAPDLWPEAQRRRPGTVRLHRRPSQFIAAAVAFALAIPATVLVVRAFGGGTAGRSPSPRSSVARCIQAKATGDFDGDGTVDTAGFVEVVPAGVACEQEGGVVAHVVSQEVVIRFGSGPTLVQPFSDCEGGACANVFTATDLDGDGRDELAIDVGPGAAVASWSSTVSIGKGSGRSSSRHRATLRTSSPDRPSSGADSTPVCRARSCAR
jgi:hypothetical protein